MTNKDIENGAALAGQFAPIIKVISSHAENEVVWWGGFFGAIAGCAGAAIGPDAVIVINEAISKIVDTENKKRAN